MRKQDLTNKQTTRDFEYIADLTLRSAPYLWEGLGRSPLGEGGKITPSPVAQFVGPDLVVQGTTNTHYEP